MPALGLSEWLSIAAVVISLGALATSIFSASTAFRSLKQSGAAVKVVLLGLIFQGEWEGEQASLTCKLELVNQGRAPVQVRKLRVSWVPSQEWTVFDIPEDERLIEGYGLRRLTVDMSRYLRGLFWNGAPGRYPFNLQVVLADGTILKRSLEFTFQDRAFPDEDQRKRSAAYWSEEMLYEKGLKIPWWVRRHNR